MVIGDFRSECRYEGMVRAEAGTKEVARKSQATKKSYKKG